MENFKPIGKHEVWKRLQAGERVYAVVLQSKEWNRAVHEIWHKSYNIADINELLSDKEKNVVFYMEVKKQ